MGALYQKGKIVKSLRDYFEPYINVLTRPSGNKLFLILQGTSIIGAGNAKRML
jgi:hypothetical protein